MTLFLDVRLSAVGGELAAQVSTNQGSDISNYVGLPLNDLLTAIRGQHVLIVSHGFNVDRADGIASLSNWAGLLQLPTYAVFIGILWPGDSVWAHGLDYPDEPRIADEAGALIANFIDENFAQAASLSFASHSLGARVALSTISQMSLPVRRLTLMAGAIDDNCLNSEFQATATKIGAISALSSNKDKVLSMAFPLGNLFAGIIAAGHPWWRAAIGHCGPVKQWPANFQAPFEIPDNWNYQHGDYLHIDNPPAPSMAVPTDVPPNDSPEPASGVTGWTEAFSSAFVSTRFQ